MTNCDGGDTTATTATRLHGTAKRGRTATSAQRAEREREAVKHNGYGYQTTRPLQQQR